MRHFLLLLMVTFHLPTCFGQHYTSFIDDVFRDTIGGEVLGKKFVRVTQRWKKTNEFNVALFYLEGTPYLWNEVDEDGNQPDHHTLNEQKCYFNESKSNNFNIHAIINNTVWDCLSDSTRERLARTGDRFFVWVNLRGDGRISGVCLYFSHERTDVITDEEKVLALNALTHSKCYTERFPKCCSFICTGVAVDANIAYWKRQYYFDLLKK